MSKNILKSGIWCSGKSEHSKASLSTGRFENLMSFCDVIGFRGVGTTSYKVIKRK